jgi:hypothetical protein
MHSIDGGIVLDVLRGQMLRLNFVGSKILQLLEQGRVESEIADELVREFKIDCATAEVDVREFTQTLKKHYVLTMREGSSFR